ncbi:MAG: hypothetical protein DCF16_05090 [Alphaproteobacteria bacterium]|nr:MAG: hypothetical protein DCF16_05090 [Alphaproteobacteria bacterium]
MAPKPQVVPPETKVIRPRGRARQRVRRWPLIWTLILAIAASLLLWAGIFGVIGAAVDALS